MAETLKTYNQQFESIVNRIDTLNFDEIYNSETDYKFEKRQAPCPFCGSGTSNHKNSDGAFTFYRSINIAKCYSCGTSAGIVKLIMHEKGCSYKEAIHYIAKEHLSTDLEHPEERIEITNFKPKKKIELSERKKFTEQERKAEGIEKRKKFEYIKSKIIEVKDVSQAGEYLVSRGLNLGMLPENSYNQAAPYKNLPSGVVFFDSESKCLNKRYLQDKLPTGINKAFTFGEMLNSVYDKTFRKEKKSIYITEGVINALSIYQCEESAIALFASTNYITDIQKFKPYFNDKEIILAFDPDKAGMQSAIKQAYFISNNFEIKSISIISFPENNDANDLLIQNKLKEFTDNRFNYIFLDKTSISTELKKIQADQRNYHPQLRLNNYYSRPAAHEEKDGTFKPFKEDKVPEETINLFKGTNLLKNEDFKKYGIAFLKEYEVVDSNTVHVHKSIKGLPIFQIPLGEKTLAIWRPFSKKPFNEFEIRGNNEINFIGLTRIKANFASLNKSKQVKDVEDDDVEIVGSKKIERIVIVYNMIDFLNLVAIDEYPVYNLNGKLTWFEFDKLEGYAEEVFQLPTNNPKDIALARRNGLKFIDIKTMHVPQLNGHVLPSIKSFFETYQEPRIFKKQLNTALPYKFWEIEKKEYDINIIKLRNFLQANGYYTFPALQEKQGYMYIKVNGRIVKRMDKDTFPRHIETFVDRYLERRGESVKLRNKVSISSRFTESNLSGIKEIKLDFQNAGKEFQNWFFADGKMWTVTKNGIQNQSQGSLKKYVWDDELMNYPSKVLEAPFNIFYRKSYLDKIEALKNLERTDEQYFKMKVEIASLKDVDKYDIEILDRTNYFLQFLFLTSHVHYEKVERKGIDIKPEDFWYNLKDVLSEEEIRETKLHLINKLTWLGYIMKDYKSMSDDYGLAILDAIDNEDGLKKKGAAGGGKSIITKAIKEIKRTLILKAEKEDWCEDKHRYENYNGEKVIVADDMHLKSRIGNMLTDFSEGIEVNPKHRRPRKIPFIESPKIIVTRNYIDDEGERVDRRLGRMFVFPFFHDNKGGRHKERRRPSDYFKRMLFQDDTDEQKSQLVNLFAYCYIANLKYGEVNPPMMDMEKFRLSKRIGEPLIEFLDLFFEDPTNFGYIERVPLYNNFKEQMRNSMSQYQRTNIYSTSQKFKTLVEYYCQLRDYKFNPEDEINDHKKGRIMKQSKVQLNKHGQYIRTEHFCIRIKDVEMPDSKEAELKQNKHLNFNDNGDDIPF